MYTRGHCNGTGHDPRYGRISTCSSCKGTGQITENQRRFAVFQTLFILIVIGAIAVAILYFMLPHIGILFNK